MTSPDIDPPKTTPEGLITTLRDNTGVTIETDLRYGIDIASFIVGAVHDRNAGATVFTPCGQSRWRKLLIGDVTHDLVRSSNSSILVPLDREVEGA